MSDASECLATTQLEYFATITMGQSPDAAAVNGEERGLAFLQGCAEFGARFPQPLIHCSPPLRVAKSGSTLISVRAPVGTTNRADQDYCIGRGLGAVLAKPGVADDIFLLHAIEANVGFLHRRSQGSTFLAIGSKELSSLPIPALPIATQRRIAEILSTLDEAIEQTEALIAKHQQIKAGLMQDLFTRGVTPDGHLRPTRDQAPDLYKPSPLGWVPKEWVCSSLGNEVEFRAGYAFKNHELSEDGLKVVRISNLHKADFPYWKYNGPTKRDWFVNDGDLLFSWAGVASSIDAYLYRGETALLNQHIYNFYLESETRKLWIYFWLQFQLPKLRESIEGGAGQLHLTKSKIEQINIPLPDSKELDLLLDRIRGAHEQIAINEHMASKLQMSKSGLMHDLLTGRVQVKDADDGDVPT